MSTNIECTEYLLHVPATLSKSYKRWQLAFATIYCSRTFSSLLKNPTLSKKPNKVPRCPSYSLVSIDATDFSEIDQTTLAELVKEKDLDRLSRLKGVDGLTSALKTHVKNGIDGNDDDIARRHEAFGSNTYQKPPAKSFFYFVIEAFKDLTILILLGCAALSLGFGIKEYGLKEEWYDWGSIFVAVFLAIAISAGRNFRQNRLDQLSKVSNNIKIDVVRRGRQQQISIFNIVVGDVVCLKTGDQVPADGLFLNGHSLQVDESSMTRRVTMWKSIAPGILS